MNTQARKELRKARALMVRNGELDGAGEITKLLQGIYVDKRTIDTDKSKPKPKRGHNKRKVKLPGGGYTWVEKDKLREAEEIE